MREKKTDKADLEKKRGLLFQIGLVLALATVLWVLNMRTNNSQKIQTTGDVTGLEIELLSGEQKVAKPPEKKRINNYNSLKKEGD